jgi:nicotinamidase/pyrazinamidase
MVTRKASAQSIVAFLVKHGLRHKIAAMNEAASDTAATNEAAKNKSVDNEAALPDLTPHDALLIIDMQQDFLPLQAGFTGALAVGGGHELIVPIEALARRFQHVILTQDFHPAGHISFASSHAGKQPFTDTVEAAYGTQTLWPEHCLQGSRGAELAVNIPHAELILRKGFRQHIDSYSAFLENDHTTGTGLAGYLRERELKRLFFCGLAFDFCVGYSAVDGATLGFECIVLEALTRAVGLPGTVEAARHRFASSAIQLC